MICTSSPEVKQQITGLDHTLNKFSDDVDSSPVTTMHDDIAFSFVLGEFLCVVVLNVAFANGGYL